MQVCNFIVKVKKANTVEHYCDGCRL